MKRSLLLASTSALLAMSMAVPTFAAAKSTAKVNPACMGAAVTARDTAISGALQSVVTAIDTRGQSVSAAWGNADPKARTAAIKAANDAFKGTWQTFSTSRKSAWTQFKTAAAACHAGSTDVQTPSSSAGSM